jgi:hypothetical protein
MQCAKCGFDNPAMMKFCGECGAALPSAKRPPVPSAESRVPSPSQSLTPKPQPPATYTSQHLADRIQAEQTALEARGSADGERKTITAGSSKGSPRRICRMRRR